MNDKCRAWAWVVAFGVGATAVFAEKENAISLSDVPANVIAAAQGASPGIKLTEAEAVTTGGELQYEVEGTAADGKHHEIRIASDGKVLADIHYPAHAATEHDGHSHGDAEDDDGESDDEDDDEAEGDSDSESDDDSEKDGK